MNRIAQAFSKAKSEGRAAFVAYVCAGDPDAATSREICRTLVDAGVDILELGVPFSDPLADGLTNQLAAQRALEAGMTPDETLAIARDFRKGDDVTPIVFYTYYNLLFSNGLDAAVAAAKAAGVDGLLTLDLPPEEAGDYLDSCKRHGVDTVFLLAPTTPPARAAYIAQRATGFVYYVSRTGVTGVRESLAEDLKEQVATIRRATDKPLAIGFGISKREQVAAVAELADGVVVGSAIVNTVKDNLGDRAAMLARMSALVKDLVAGARRPATAV